MQMNIFEKKTRFLWRDKIFGRDGLFFIFIIVLSLLAYRATILNPGTVARIDLDATTPYNFPNWAGHWMNEGFYSWWEVDGGYPFPNLSFLPVIIFAKIGSFILNADQFKQLLFVLFTALSGLSSYLMVKNMAFGKVKALNVRHRIASLIAAVGYMFNPWVFDHTLFAIPYVFAYAIAPLALMYVVKAMDSASKLNKQHLILAVLTFSFVTILALPVGYMLLLATILYFIFRVVLNIRKSKTAVLGTILAGTIFVFLVLALNAYWSIMQFSSTQLAPSPGTSVDDIGTNSVDCYVYNIFRLSGSPYGFFAAVAKSFANPVTIFLSFVVPLLSFSSLIIVKPKDEKAIFFSILAAISIALGAGILGPLGNGYVWLFLHVPFFNIFRVSYKFVFLTSLAYAYLIGVVAEYLIKNAKFSRVFNSSQAIKYVVLIIVLLSLSFNAAPMLTGNMAGYLPNFQLPSEYAQVYNMLATQQGDFRILLLPMNTPLKAVWLPANIPYIHNPFDVNSLNHPVVCNDIATPTTATLIKFFQNTILGNNTNDFSSLLTMLSVKYIVVNKDNIIGEQLPPPNSAAWTNIAYGWQGFYIPPEQIMNFLTNNSKLIVIYNGEYLSVFEYDKKLSPLIYANSASSLIVGGGYDDLAETPSTAGLFAVQSYEDCLLNNSNLFSNVLFYNANVTDLALSTLNHEYVFLPYDYAYHGYSFSKYWCTSDYFPVTYEPFTQGAPIDGKFAFASISANNVNMSIPFSFRGNYSYDIWASVLFDQSGGTLRFTLGNKTASVDTFSSIPGFKWVRIFGSTDLPSGEGHLEISNAEGKNMLDRIVIVPSFILNELKNKYSTILQEKNVTSIQTGTEAKIQVSDGQTNPFNWATFNLAEEDLAARYYSGWQAVIRTDGSNSWDTLSFSSPDECPYEFPQYSQGYLNAYNSTLVYMTTDQEPLNIDAIYANEAPAYVIGVWWNSSWVGMGTKPINFPITIPSNQRVIILIGNKVDEVTILYENRTETLLNVNYLSRNYSTEGAELTYEKINPTQYSVKVNASKPFSLVFSESYDNGWIVTIDGQQIPNQYHFVANGFANGWYINKTGTYTITLEFWPQNLFYIGSAISVTTLIACLTYLTYNWTKNKAFWKRTKRKKFRN